MIIIRFKWRMALMEMRKLKRRENSLDCVGSFIFLGGFTT